MLIKTKIELKKLHSQGAWDVLRKECQTYGNVISRDNWDSEEGDRYDGYGANRKFQLKDTRICGYNLAMPCNGAGFTWRKYDLP